MGSEVPPGERLPASLWQRGSQGNPVPCGALPPPNPPLSPRLRPSFGPNPKMEQNGTSGHTLASVRNVTPFSALR